MEFNLADLFECVADAVPERIAVAAGDRSFTFAELDERATRLAHHLASAGIGPGDHVGLYLLNGVEYLEASLAAHKMRAVPINVNYRYVAAELEYLFRDAELKGLVHHKRFVPHVAEVRSAVPGLCCLLCVDDSSFEDPATIGSTDYEEALAAASKERDFEARSADDLYILYTGGTTGMPKGVMWRQEDLFFAALGGGNIMGDAIERPEEIADKATERSPFSMIPAAPLMHGSAQWAAWITLYGGGTLVIPTSRSFNPDEIWQLVERHGVNQIALVGDAMARPLAEQLAKPGVSYDTSSLIVVGSGGAVFSAAVKQQLADQLPDLMIFDGFGGSEVGHQGTGSGTGEGGRPKFMVDERTAVFTKDLERIVPGSGQVGRLAKTGNIPLGYYNDPEKTARTFVTVDGTRWVLPGDNATIEEDGRTITLLGRDSVCINSGGEKIYTEEVEAALKDHPAVFDVIVVGVPDERFGQRVAAVVQARPGMTVTLEDLDQHCRSKISGYKVPRQLTVVEEVERQPSGKPDYKWAASVALGESG